MLTIDLAGKLALVTGGSGDLGRVMVRTLAACGADVAIHYAQNAQQAEALVAEVRALGRRALAVQADITAAVDVNAMRDTVRSKLGDPDIVVTNAVIQIHPWSPVLDEALEDYESQFRSSVMQNVHMAKAFVPAMIAKRWGRVIGINTECTMACAPQQSAYVSGKGGMDRLLRVLAREVAEHQITVNQVAPGWMISDRDRAASDGVKLASGSYAQSVPMRHRGTDADIAHTVAFLASDLANFITGAFIPVNGGNSMVGI